jgi:hypothetical protein
MSNLGKAHSPRQGWAKKIFEKMKTPNAKTFFKTPSTKKIILQNAKHKKIF